MRRFIYRGNFCTECGNPLAKPSGWWPRVFCADCASQLRRSQRLPGKGWLWLFALFIAALFYTLNHSAAQPTPAPPLQQLVTTNEAPAAFSPPIATPETAAVFCGARTRKGTPCRRLVKAGQRCAQHRGKPSLLKSETNMPASQ
jgi:hypothetical protein